MFVKIVTKDHGIIEVNKNLVCTIRRMEQYGFRDEFEYEITMVNGESYHINFDDCWLIKVEE
jgi:hypothetical protein